jgi:hypothetical protein
MDTQFKDAVVKFLTEFEQVFDKDWDYTKQQLGISEETELQKENSRKLGLETIYRISPNGTFLNPKVDDEIEDWGYRGSLLREYRALKKLLTK